MSNPSLTPEEKMRLGWLKIMAQADEEYCRLTRESLTADALMLELREELTPEQYAVVERINTSHVALTNRAFELGAIHLVMAGEHTPVPQEDARPFLIDITGTHLVPGNQGKDCPGNGEVSGVECCCEECDYMLCCLDPQYPGRCDTCTIWNCPRNRCQDPSAPFGRSG